MGLLPVGVGSRTPCQLCITTLFLCVVSGVVFVCLLGMAQLVVVSVPNPHGKIAIPGEAVFDVAGAWAILCVLPVSVTVRWQMTSSGADPAPLSRVWVVFDPGIGLVRSSGVDRFMFARAQASSHVVAQGVTTCVGFAARFARRIIQEVFQEVATSGAGVLAVAASRVSGEEKVVNLRPIGTQYPSIEVSKGASASNATAISYLDFCELVGVLTDVPKYKMQEVLQEVATSGAGVLAVAASRVFGEEKVVNLRPIGTQYPSIEVSKGASASNATAISYLDLCELVGVLTDVPKYKICCQLCGGYFPCPSRAVVKGSIKEVSGRDGRQHVTVDGEEVAICRQVDGATLWMVKFVVMGLGLCPPWERIFFSSTGMAQWMRSGRAGLMPTAGSVFSGALCCRRDMTPRKWDEVTRARSQDRTCLGSTTSWITKERDQADADTWNFFQRHPVVPDGYEFPSQMGGGEYCAGCGGVGGDVGGEGY